MSSRRRHVRRRGDDAAGLAGWLYTDLLLGLAVVFLGAITFTAATKPDESATPTTTPATTASSTTTSTTVPPTTVPPEPCGLRRETEEKVNRIRLTNAGVSDEALAAEFRAKLAEKLGQRGLDPDTVVGFALVFADASSEETAKARARDVALRLQLLVQDKFGRAPFLALYDRSLNNAVNIDLFFLQGDCQ